MKKISLSIVLISSLLAWQCSKQITPVGQQSLKESLNTSSQNLNTAVNAISQTYGYKVLSLNENSTAKSTFSPETAFQDSITLAKIKGIYEYKPVTYTHWCFSCFSKLFARTGDSNDMIVKLPEAKVFFPSRFQVVTPSDSSLKNNLVIDASDYHYYFSMGFLWDYKLAASLTLNDTALGNISIQSARNTESGFSYSSSYMFPGNYDISVTVTSGDTATSSIALSNGSSILFKETVNRYKVGMSKFHEREYILDIGNVEFKRAVGADSISVYVGGILQTKAKIEVIDSSSSTGSIFGGRDIKVTFDDGTSATLSSLLSPTFTVFNNLVVNLQNVYFATNIVDYIAFNIFKNQTP